MRNAGTILSNQAFNTLPYIDANKQSEEKKGVFKSLTRKYVPLNNPYAHSQIKPAHMSKIKYRPYYGEEKVKTQQPVVQQVKTQQPVVQQVKPIKFEQRPSINKVPDDYLNIEDNYPNLDKNQLFAMEGYNSSLDVSFN